MKKINLGDFEKKVLAAILKKGNVAYPQEVQEEIRICTGCTYGVSNIYTVLERLEKKGFVKSKLRFADDEQRQRHRLTFIVSATGKKVLIKTMQSLHMMGLVPAGIISTKAGILKTGILE